MLVADVSAITLTFLLCRICSSSVILTLLLCSVCCLQDQCAASSVISVPRLLLLLSSSVVSVPRLLADRSVKISSVDFYAALTFLVCRLCSSSVTLTLPLSRMCHTFNSKTFTRTDTDFGHMSSYVGVCRTVYILSDRGFIGHRTQAG